MDLFDASRFSQLNQTSCRLCLVSEASSNTTPECRSMIYKLTDLQISDSDFSTSICVGCSEILASFVEFRRRCHETSEFLTSYAYFHIGKPEPQNLATDKQETEVSSEESNLQPILETTDPQSFPKLKKRDLLETKAYRGLCHHCGREFQHLWVHLQSHSEHPTETCHICGKGFKSKPNLQLHVLLHKEAQLPCDVCGKKYRTKMRLKRHQRVHNGHRPFECGVCAKKFYTKYNLDVHGRSHTGSRPYTCAVCEESFIHSYALKNHTVKFHKSK